MHDWYKMGENKRFIVIYSHIGFISWILSLIYQFRFSVCFYSKMTLSTVKLNITLFPSWNKHSFLLNSRELHKLWTSMHDTSWFHEIKINSDIFRYFRLYVCKASITLVHHSIYSWHFPVFSPVCQREEVTICRTSRY